MKLKNWMKKLTVLTLVCVLGTGVLYTANPGNYSVSTMSILPDIFVVE